MRSCRQILEQTLRLDAKMTFCLPIDRNGYIPVHNQRVSQPQRKGERVWSIANCRNRRIFDDRAGLLGRPHRAPLPDPDRHDRDMGDRVMAPMKEIDVPLVISGRALGGIRRGLTRFRRGSAAGDAHVARRTAGWSGSRSITEIMPARLAGNRALDGGHQGRITITLRAEAS